MSMHRGPAVQVNDSQWTGKKEEAMYSNVCQSVSISSPFLRKQVQETGEGGGPPRLLPPPPTLQHAKLMFYYHNNYYYRNPIIIILLQLNQYYCTYKRARSPAEKRAAYFDIYLLIIILDPFIQATSKIRNTKRIRCLSAFSFGQQLPIIDQYLI